MIAPGDAGGGSVKSTPITWSGAKDGSEDAIGSYF